MPEIIQIDQYPDINWSLPTTHANGDPDDTFGVVQVIIGSQDIKMDRQHNLVITELKTPRIHSKICFGRPGNPSFSFYSMENTPFSLEDPQRIKESTKEVSDVLTILYQLKTADDVTRSGRQLVTSLRAAVGFGSVEYLEKIGVIEELLSEFSENVAIERLLSDARKLQELKVPLFHEGGSLASGGYCWVTSHLTMYFETGHCPPLPVDEYLY